jgi:hypothetical protein
VDFLGLAELRDLVADLGDHHGEQQEEGGEGTAKDHDHRAESGETPALKPADEGVEEVGDDAGDSDRDQHRLQEAERFSGEPDHEDQQGADDEQGHAGGGGPDGALLEAGGRPEHGYGGRRVCCQLSSEKNERL